MNLLVLNSRKIYIGYIFILLLLFFKSVNAWFLWSVSQSLIYILGFIVGVLYYNVHSKHLIVSRYDIVLLFLFVVLKCYAVYQGVSYQYMLYALCGILPILLLIIEEYKIKSNIFDTIVSVYCGILLISLIAWILFLLGMDLPNISTSWEGQYEYRNYFLFLYNKWD